MPLKLSVGLTKKVGLPDYGSLGASCHVEVELEGALLHQDLEGFHRHVKNAYVACAQAVNDELARHPRSSPPPAQNGGEPAAAEAAGGPPPASRGENGNGRHASEKQLAFIQQLARQVRGLGVRRLEALAAQMFNKRPAELTSLEASGLIDTLKAIKEGRIQLDEALQGAVS